MNGLGILKLVCLFPPAQTKISFTETHSGSGIPQATQCSVIDRPNVGQYGSNSWGADFVNMGGWRARKRAPSWWRHQMETFSTLLPICARNSLVTGEFPTQRPVTRSFDIFFDLSLNKQLSKQSWGWWFETPSRPIWRHSNGWLAQCFTWWRHDLYENTFRITGHLWLPLYSLSNDQHCGASMFVCVISMNKLVHKQSSCLWFLNALTLMVIIRNTFRDSCGVFSRSFHAAFSHIIQGYFTDTGPSKFCDISW